jgi:plastocyanin
MIAPLALAQPKPEPKHDVAIKDMKFDPADLKIKVGETVVWTNKDDRDHTVVMEKGPLKSENLKPGGTYSYKFTKAGKFEYGCSYHPRMKATVTVAE